MNEYAYGCAPVNIMLYDMCDYVISFYFNPSTFPTTKF